MKTCNKCGKEKPLDDFYKRRKYSEKRFNTCKSCVIERVQERNALHKAEKSAYDAERYAQDHHYTREVITMSRRHHHTDRTPHTEINLTPAADSMLDALEIEVRARNLYELTEQQAVAELNAERPDMPWAQVGAVPWDHTDPDTRRDYRLHITARMHEAGQLRGDRRARGQSVTDGPTGIRFDL